MLFLFTRRRLDSGGLSNHGVERTRRLGLTTTLCVDVRCERGRVLCLSNTTNRVPVRMSFLLLERSNRIAYYTIQYHVGVVY